MGPPLQTSQNQTSPILQFVALLEHKLDQAKAMNVHKGSILADLLDVEARAGEVLPPMPIAHGELASALDATRREIEAIRAQIVETERSIRRADVDLDAARLRIAREHHREKHGDPRVREMTSALSAAEGLQQRAREADAAERRDPSPHAHSHELLVGAEQARAALARACAAARVARLGCEQLHDALRADLAQAQQRTGGASSHKSHRRRAHRDEAEGASDISLRREMSLAAADAELCERWFSHDAAHHAQLAREVDVLEALAEERAGWLARLRLDVRELGEAAALAQEATDEPLADGPADGAMALLRALATPAASAESRFSAAAALSAMHAHELAERKHALVRLRERCASVQSYHAEAERRAREAESALVASLRAYADRARAAHGACARVHALDELWAQGATSRVGLEARLTEAIADLLARMPPHAPETLKTSARARASTGAPTRKWAPLAEQISAQIAEARHTLEALNDGGGDDSGVE